MVHMRLVPGRRSFVPDGGICIASRGVMEPSGIFACRGFVFPFSRLDRMRGHKVVCAMGYTDSNRSVAVCPD